MGRTLHDSHHDLLRASAISEEVIAERGYRTATRKAELADLGFSLVQRSVPALVIPIRNAAGEKVNFQSRPDEPRINEKGRPVKYESPAGIPPTLDVPPRCAKALKSVDLPLWITEGARKADAAASAGLCCVSLPGVWSFAKRLNGEARQVLPDLQRVRLEGRKVVVAFDSDAMVKAEVHKALEALAKYLTSQGALVSFLYLPELEPGVKCGLDDYLATHTVEDAWGLVKDELRAPSEAKAERGPVLPTAILLNYVGNLIRRYVHFPDEHGPVALALYVLHTWSIEAVSVTPYLYVKSPQKQSGKTRLLEVLELVCRESVRAGSITAAAVYQVVQHKAPSLLIDEADAVFSTKSEQAEALRGVLNGGNRRGSKAIRGTADGEPVEYELFCCKVLAGIDTGKLPDTIRDRAIVVGLERKLRAEPVERLRVDDLAEQLAELEKWLADWAAEHHDELARYRCESLQAISDRLEEAWEPLLGIADLAGGDWPTKARDAAVTLAKGAEDLGEDHGQLLLQALRRIFGTKDAMFTTDITAALNADDDLPFGAYRNGQGIDARGLSRRLKPYGVKPKNVRVAGGQGKGYQREQFTEVWERYTPAPDLANDPSHPSQRPTGAGSPVIERDAAGTGSENGSVPHPSRPDPAPQSRNGGHWDRGTDGTANERSVARTQDLPLETDRGADTAERIRATVSRRPCSCARPGELEDDGRCGRCWGWPG